MSEELEADVVIVGSGVAGALAAYDLASAGLKVLVLEAGPRVDRGEIFESFLKSDKFDPVSIYPNTRIAPRPDPSRPDDYIIRDGDYPYAPQYIRAVGGTTWHWTAGMSRLTRFDLTLRSTYGVGVDWPLTAEELEPFYVRAQTEMGAAGALEDDPEAEAAEALPMAPLPLPYFHRTVSQRLAPLGFFVNPVHAARNSRVYDGRPACVGNNNCLPICPIGAQYAAIVHVEKAEAKGARVLSDAVVYRLEAGEDGAIAAAHFLRPDNSTGIARGRVFIVAANALEGARLMLMSRSERWPDGLANSSGLVGRNFMDHPGVVTRLMTPYPLWPGRGPTNAGAIRFFSNGPFRSERGASGLSLDNKLKLHDISERLLRAGLEGEELDAQIRYRAARTFEIVSFVEMLPDPENRLTLAWDRLDTAGLPRMRLRLDVGDYARNAMTFMRGIHEEIAAQLEVLEIGEPQEFTANHLLGTMVMGADPKRSVVDPFCRTHDHRNLYVGGSAVFPTAGAHKGPTFTIAALSLRLAADIRRALQPG